MRQPMQKLKLVRQTANVNGEILKTYEPQARF
jgi:hypothetical protein